MAMKVIIVFVHVFELMCLWADVHVSLFGAFQTQRFIIIMIIVCD